MQPDLYELNMLKYEAAERNIPSIQFINAL
jgi:hypothetical protein